MAKVLFCPRCKRDNTVPAAFPSPETDEIICTGCSNYFRHGDTDPKLFRKEDGNRLILMPGRDF